MDRITFYSENDLLFNREHSKLEQRLSKLQDSNDLKLVDILELNQIIKYISKDTDKKYKNIIKNIRAKINKWFSTTQFKQMFIQIKEEKFSKEYNLALWQMISKQFKNRNLSRNDVEQLLSLYSENRIYFPLTEKSIVNSFGAIICKHLVSSEKNIPIVLTVHSKPIFLPKEFDSTMRDNYLMGYINSNDPNPNLLKQISLDNKVNISVKLAAQKKDEEITNDFFENHQNSGLKLSLETSIQKLEDNKIKSFSENDKNITEIIYNQNILSEFIDWPTILNNFIYIFEYVDKLGILTIAPKNEQISPLERVLFGSQENVYNVGSELKTIIDVLLSSFIVYYNFLNNNGIQLERIIEWFFSDYMRNNFKISGLDIIMPQKAESYEIKELLTVTQLHRIIRMYNLYAEDAKFNRDLIDNYSKTDTNFENIKSILSRKYAKINDQRILSATEYLFSDQSIMPSGNEKSFGDNVKNNNINSNELDDLQKQVLNELIQLKILVCDKNIIKFRYSDVYITLKTSFEYSSIPFIKLLSRLEKHTYLDDLENNKKIEFSSRLFTEYEAGIFNYYFADTYKNSLGLRNVYAHGAFNSLSEIENYENYLTTLMFIIFIIIKINDELDMNDVL